MVSLDKTTNGIVVVGDHTIDMSIPAEKNNYHRSIHILEEY